MAPMGRIFHSPIGGNPILFGFPSCSEPLPGASGDFQAGTRKDPVLGWPVSVLNGCSVRTASMNDGPKSAKVFG